jgi:tetratricopeptide (TPR) repeat protein
MMRIFLIVLFIYPSIKCLAQNAGSLAPVVVPLADSLYFNGWYKEAIPYYEKFLKDSNPIKPLAHYRLAYAYHQNGNIDMALHSYQNCLSKNPNANLARITYVNLG